jgi:hypothetical protein
MTKGAPQGAPFLFGASYTFESGNDALRRFM